MNNDAIQDEAQVPAYELPPLLRPGETAASWPERREELLRLFSDHVYGRTPALKKGIFPATETVEAGPAPFPVPARRRQFRIAVGDTPFTLLVYTPEEQRPEGCTFLGLNFAGNHTLSTDPEVLVPSGWMYPWENTGVLDNRATEDGRGARAFRWPVADILRRGHSLATVYCGDTAPDRENHPQTLQFKSYFEAPDAPESEWGNIGIWSWTLCRSLDVLLSLEEDVHKRVWTVGHSRLGKTAVWAAAQDTRFSGTLANNSGCLGAALSRRRFGETVAKISEGYPHWFCPRLRSYADREGDMPVDQHQFLALIAPRPLAVGSASRDLWSDPRGEFLSLAAAGEAWEPFGYETLADDAFPSPHSATVRGRLSYHLREGAHNLLPEDWTRYMDFAEACSKNAH